jgi:hypothetical protein
LSTSLMTSAAAKAQKLFLPCSPSASGLSCERFQTSCVAASLCDLHRAPLLLRMCLYPCLRGASLPVISTAPLHFLRP